MKSYSIDETEGRYRKLSRNCKKFLVVQKNFEQLNYGIKNKIELLNIFGIASSLSSKPKPILHDIPDFDICGIIIFRFKKSIQI